MIIQEMTVEIAERFPIGMEAIGAGNHHIQPHCSAQQKVASGRIVQLFKRITAHEIVRGKPAVKCVLMGWGVLDRRVRCDDGWRTRELGDCRTVCAAEIAAARRAPASQNVLVL
jgi:hypothetical protein